MFYINSTVMKGPWNKLALTVRWLKPDFQVEFPLELQPPLHMPIVFGPVKSKKVGKSQPQPVGDRGQTDQCNVCHLEVSEAQRLVCLYPRCEAVSHVLCLAETFTQTDEIIPVQGLCPTCGGEQLWGNLIRKRRGCYENLDEEEDFED